MKIAILGFAYGYKEAPFQDPSVQIWGLNELYRHIPRWDAWFELHDRAHLGKTARIEDPKEPERHWNYLKAQAPGKPIYMQRVEPDVPASVAYPIEQMIGTFGRYFSSSIGYMLALAIAKIQVHAQGNGHDGTPGWIGLYGIDLASESEYKFQRPNAEYFIGLARGLGIEVYVQPQDAVLKAPALYGYEPEPAEDWFVVSCQEQIQKMRDQHGQAMATMNGCEGAIQAFSYILKEHEMRRRGVNPQERKDAT